MLVAHSLEGYVIVGRRVLDRADLFEESLRALLRAGVALAHQERVEATPEIREALLRIQTEYVEMPDLKLTARQAQRLWSLSHEVWTTSLAVLIGTQFLVQTRDGAYVRSSAMRTSHSEAA